MIDFTGYSGIAKLDSQGRVPILAPLCRILQQSGNNTLFIRIDVFNDCLELYSKDTWEAKQAQYRKRLNESVKEEEDFYQSLVAAVDRVEMDSVGRIQFTKRAMRHANITTEALFIGSDDKIKIWNPERFKEIERKNRENFEENAKKFLQK